MMLGKQGRRVVVREGNEGTIDPANNPLSWSAQSKHIDIRYQFIRNEVREDWVTIIHSGSGNQCNVTEPVPQS